ncbi:hypothetical protein [Paenibacillus sp. IHBB 10380]|uniref:hypothetical protein n=1 Tax=Paenibacillus sp. IHBB 10380 TaxID=1566358 RepID=UPI0005CFD52D|nr:hypothetical protein [Paenibacillus sp. IHBB 10380]AJS59836.1 hypothetical protein UB51_16640 [Paenibacillus sp. IHBB 10380]
MNVKQELHIAASSNQRVTVKLTSGEVINGFAEVSTDAERAKIRTSEGPMWVPYEDIEDIERIAQMLH